MPSGNHVAAGATGLAVLAAAGVLLVVGNSQPERTVEEIIEQQTIITGYASEEEALAVSRADLESRQSPETRSDPNTVSRYSWGVVESEGPGPKEWGLIVPDDETNRIPETVKGRLTTRGKRGGKWHKEPPQPGNQMESGINQ